MLAGARAELNGLRTIASVHTISNFHKAGSSRSHHDLGVSGTVFDAERIQNAPLGHHVVDKLLLDFTSGGKKLGVVVSDGSVFEITILSVNPDGSQDVLAVAAHGVNDVLKAAEELLNQNFVADVAENVHAAEIRLASVDDILLVRAEIDAVGGSGEGRAA